MLAPNSEVLKQPKSERIRKAKERSATAPQDPLTVLRTSIDLDNNGKQEVFVKDIYENCEKRVPLPRVVLRPVGEDTVNTKILDILRSAQYREGNTQKECEPYKTGDVPTENSLDVRDSLKRERCKMAMTDGVTLKEKLGGFMFPDVFHYKNEWYLDVWATERGSNYLNAGHLHVFQHKNGKTAKLCEFDVHGNAR